MGMTHKGLAKMQVSKKRDSFRLLFPAELIRQLEARLGREVEQSDLYRITLDPDAPRFVVEPALIVPYSAEADATP